MANEESKYYEYEDSEGNRFVSVTEPCGSYDYDGTPLMWSLPFRDNRDFERLERVVAAKDAEIAIMESRASQFESTLKETMRVRDEIIAEQKRVIERARELYINAIRLIDKYSKEKNPFNQTVTFDEVLKQYEDELEKARGAK